ncbi:sulfatase [Myxococcota bacterium]|nr:sulfatase [Myxococcota bacterium]
MLSALLSSLLACQRPPAPAPPPADVDLSPGRGQRMLRLLDRVRAEGLQLSATNLPADAAAPALHRLDRGWTPAPWSAGKVWERASPVDLPGRHPAMPEHLSLSAGGRALRYDTRISEDPSLAQRWMLWEGRIYLASRLDPGRWPEPPVLESAGAAAREAAWNLDLSGQDPLSFARRSLSVGRVTRPCLYLPAPSRAELRLPVPAEGGSLVMDLALATPGEGEATATAALEVAVEGQPLGRVEVHAGEAWAPARFDLGAWAGQEVTLLLSSDPLGDPVRDYLCVGAPRLLATPPPSPDPARIVVLGIDTLRADHTGAHGETRGLTPHLDAVAAQAVVFERAWAPAPRTRPSFRTSTTGRWPLQALATPSMGRVLGDHGFATAGIVANVHLAPRLGFSDGYDLWSYDDGATADTQVDRAIAWLENNRDQDALLFLHLMDPHTFYLAPAPYTDRYVDLADRGDVPDRFNRWMVQEWQEQGGLSEAERRFIAGRYAGEVAFTDAQVGRLLAALDALPGRTLLVVHTDHGEELWDHGAFEHNHSLYDELTRSLLWVRPPGGRQGGLRLPQPASLADLAPTLYEAAGVPAAEQPQVDGQSLWPLVDPGEQARGAAVAQALDARPLHLGYLMFDTERWAVVAPDARGALHKYVLVTATGEQQLYDLVADPGERRDLAQAPGFDPTPWARALSQATGWPVGPGWRLHLDGARAPFTLTLPSPARHAFVVDPEAALPRRANLEWGEAPAVTADQVATVQLSADGLQVQVRPGPRGTGTLALIGPTAPLTLAQDGGAVALTPGPHPLPGGGRLTAAPGTVILPLLTEAGALAAQQPTEDATAAQLESLRVLGYIEGD